MKESVHRIRSEALGNERTVWIVEPKNPIRAERVLIFLDGEPYREQFHVTEMVRELVAEGRMADCWIVYVSHLDIETRARECPCYPPFARFVAVELLDFLAVREPRLGETMERVLIGFSYTGLAAAFVAREFPGRFQKVIAQSGSFWSDDCWLVHEYARSASPVPTQFFLQIGRKEFQTNVRHSAHVVQKISQIEGVMRFRDVLVATGHGVKYFESDGGHEYGNWIRALPVALEWACPTAAAP
jgi:enterochelin esterase family protein